MDTIFEFIYYFGFVVCLSSLNNSEASNSITHTQISHDKDSVLYHIDTTNSADSLKQTPLLLGAQQAKRLSECDSIGIYR